MPTVVMPRLSDSMEEGTVLKWLKADGDTVSRGDELVEIETDKATMSCEAEADGILRVIVAEGETVAIGTPIAIIGDADVGSDIDVSPPTDGDVEEIAGEVVPSSADPDREPAPAPVFAARPSAAAPDSTNGDAMQPARAVATPVARRMAAEHGIDLTSVVGTGPGGRVRKADVEGLSSQTAREGVASPSAVHPSGAEPAKGQPAVVELSRLQQIVARKMAETKATVPEFDAEVDVDMAAAVDVRGQLRAVAGDHPVPSYNDFVLKACAIALTEHPRVNGSYRDGHFALYPQVNLGFAVAGEDALVVPVIADADQMSLGQIAIKARELASRVREGAITPPEISGGTFTVSNLGGMGVDRFTAVINSPQAAILAVGAMVSRPVAVDGDVVVQPMMTLRLTCDHRILYGADAATFLSRLRDLLEHPLGLAL